jgi:hypothetical protein
VRNESVSKAINYIHIIEATTQILRSQIISVLQVKSDFDHILKVQTKIGLFINHQDLEIKLQCFNGKYIATG